MADIKACLSSKRDDWSTPQDFFDKLDKEFHFDLDPCADENNHKCETYFTKEQNGLKHSWGGAYRILQSSIRKRNIEVGAICIRTEPTPKYNGCNAYCCTNGHSIFS